MKMKQKQTEKTRTSERTREPQYNNCLDIRDKEGLAELGLMSNQVWHDDPKRLVFILARYKFVAKMLSDLDDVLEIGCGDAFASRIVLQEVKNLVVTDFDPVFIKDAKDRMDKEHWKFECRVHDILKGPVESVESKNGFDAAYAIDVLEHIDKGKEDIFMSNTINSLNKKGVLIIGTPTIESQKYASKPSREGHVNCKDHKELKKLMQKYFDNVFVFSMNDEMVHTGFYPMANYLFALCTGKKS